MDNVKRKTITESVTADGYLKEDIVVTKQGMVMVQGTRLSVMNVEEEGDMARVQIMPQEGIVPPITKPVIAKLNKDDILLSLDGSDKLLHKVGLWAN